MKKKAKIHDGKPSSGNKKKPLTPSVLKNDIQHHIRFSLVKDPYRPDKYTCYLGLALSIRDRLADRWIETQQSFYETCAKRVYFLSMEFLPGRFLKNYLISLEMETVARETLREMGFDLDELEEEEWDAGLGNGGLGRLASCYMDAMACKHIPGYGYGILYDYGIFHQVFEDGYQREQSDNWLRRGSPWEIRRQDLLMPVRFGGRTEMYKDAFGKRRYRWVAGEVVMAMACDILIPGLGDTYVTNMRLWAARSSREFNLEEFNQGDYIGAVEAKVLSETISKVLYPSDEIAVGKELRLKQEYFFVAATLADILRRFKKKNTDFNDLPENVAIQLNDTHPSIAVAELMRLLVDEESLAWEDAWAICEKTFAYTNHTVLPEALETWPVDLIGRILPRHLEIIYEINHRFLIMVAQQYPGDLGLQNRLSLIQEGTVKMVRMAHLAIVGSHRVNGVAELHSRILKEQLFPDFDRLFPGRFQNVTNGITPRRWLFQANPLLSRLITSAIGPEWIRDLECLKQLVPLAEDPNFRRSWLQIKRNNKEKLAQYILRKVNLVVDPHSLFDVQAKRIHEYKRQLLNVLHVVALYSRIKANPDRSVVPRTIIFSGKAAPAYHRAKLIIKLINSIAATVNNDTDMIGKLQVVFLPNYCVSQAEKIMPAADLSEQISLAGMEASGTGNMKLSLNGALTIGTLDGANIEIMEEVGRENIFIFGLTAEQVAKNRSAGYQPREHYDTIPELRQSLGLIGSGEFSPEEPNLFTPIIRSLLDKGDFYMVLADYSAYVEAQENVSRLFQDEQQWARCSIRNTAGMGKFSSDRAIMEYASQIWDVQPVKKA